MFSKIQTAFTGIAAGAALILANGRAAYAEDIKKYIADTAVSEKGMTLWQTLAAGGWLMIVLGILSVAGLAFVIYYFIAYKPEKIMPETFIEEAMSLLEQGKHAEAKELCRTSSNMVSDLLMSGLEKMDKGKMVVKEAMEDQGRRSIDDLWLKLSYLSDVAVISPLVGLLGTILGMMQAFNVIAFQVGAVKPLLLAGGITKAMITTAAGLMIAIPAMVFYSYFRGKVQSMTAQFETVSTEMYQVLTKKES
ncbi:MAG: MotA/TolQ/ExbB proton channel family protein [Candidatus Omnitrophica bacterium]|nr:MotA/TolQ/ExbB proton channel family protein [Candidatus Omnitrophota bacterium]